MTVNGPCSLTPDAVAARAREWHSLESDLLAAEPTATGAALRYRLTPKVAETLLALLAAERSCCPSLTFEATVIVRVDAPEDQRAWVAASFT